MINFLCANVISTILYVILAIAILLLMVLIHELGHYLVGRWLGFKITEFSIGFGKAIFSKINKRGEKISLRIFPLGGFCAFAGEEGEEEEKKEKKDEKPLKEENENQELNAVLDKMKGKGDRDYLLFTEQKPWKRILVYLAGVTFNFISAILFSFILLVTTGYDIQQIDTINTNYSQPNIQVGDVIYEVDGKSIDFVTGNSLPVLISEYQPGQQFTLTIERNGERLTIECTMHQLKYSNNLTLLDSDDKPIYCDSSGNKITSKESVVEGQLLFKLNSQNTPVPVTNLGLTTKSYPLPFWQALGRSFSFTIGLAFMVLRTLWLLITFRLPLADIGGPIATVSFIATAAQGNIASVLLLLPLIAANLAVFNAIPFPALDGSHVIFTVIEWIRGKPVNRNVESYIHFFGLLILFAFIIIVDIIHLVS